MSLSTDFVDPTVDAGLDRAAEAFVLNVDASLFEGNGQSTPAGRAYLSHLREEMLTALREAASQASVDAEDFESFADGHDDDRYEAEMAF
jgi:hypothetical protein